MNVKDFWNMPPEKRRAIQEDVMPFRETRTRVEAIARCPTCRNDVELVSETEQWVEKDGYWQHDEYGPAMGVCCDNLIFDYWDGCIVVKLEKSKELAK